MTEITTTTMCDACGQEITQEWDGGWSWDIGLRFRSSWDPKGDTRLLELCQSCGSKAARLLGFQFDTGKILSMAQREYVTGCQLHQTIADIAFNGVTQGANTTHTAAPKPEIPAAAAMLDDDPSDP